MLAAFSIAPLGTGESVSEAVAGCIAIVRASGLSNETNAMFTNLEGDWDEVMGVIKKCVDHVSSLSDRVSLVVKVDIRPGASDAMHEKVRSVERRLSGEDTFG